MATRSRSLPDDDEPERTTGRRAPRDVGTSSAPSASLRQREEQHHLPTMEPLKRGSSGGGGVGGGGGGSTGNNNNRPTTAVRSSSRTLSSGTGSGGGGGPEVGDAPHARSAGGGIRGRHGSGAGTGAMRPAPKGAAGTELLVGGGGGRAGGGTTGDGTSKEDSKKKAAGSSSSSSYSYSSTRAAASVSTAPVKPKFDLPGFVEMLEGGLVVTKINRQGRAKVRTLYYHRQDEMLWWNEPGTRVGRSRGSSSLLSLRKEQPLPVESLKQVRRVLRHRRCCLSGSSTD